MVNLTVAHHTGRENAQLAGGDGSSFRQDGTPLPMAPSELAERGRRLWADVVDAYELTPTDVAILTEAARTADELDRLQRAASELSDLTTRGSRGQTVAHPLLAEVRAHRRVLDRLVAALGLDDDEGGA